MPLWQFDIRLAYISGQDGVLCGIIVSFDCSLFELSPLNELKRVNSFLCFYHIWWTSISGHDNVSRDCTVALHCFLFKFSHLNELHCLHLKTFEIFYYAWWGCMFAWPGDTNLFVFLCVLKMALTAVSSKAVIILLLIIISHPQTRI